MDGRPLAVVYNFACHPLLGVPGSALTANLPGFASEVIEDNLGDGAMALFLQGAGGDVTEVLYKDVARARDAEPVGRMLGLSTLKAARDIETGDAKLSCARVELALPRRTDIPERIAELGGRRATVRALRRLARAYLGPDGFQRGAGLFDPLLVLENEAPDRPLSPLFVAAGAGDVLFDDSRRLALAAEQHAGSVVRSFEQGQPHAFNIMLWKRAARRCWQATFEFLETVTKPQLVVRRA